MLCEVLARKITSQFLSFSKQSTTHYVHVVRRTNKAKKLIVLFGRVVSRVTKKSFWPNVFEKNTKLFSRVEYRVGVFICMET